MDELDRLLVNRLQAGIPVAERPFAPIAGELGIPEAEVCGRLQRLLEEGVLTRFGPMIDAAALGGAFTLAAMSVPPHDFDRVAAIVNARSEVAHNYRREHAFNMWFVLGCTSTAEAAAACTRIEEETGLRVYAFPKEKEFFVELRLPV